ncbi:MAG: type I-E CRISPR-associated protein Cse2/CasB [Deltaproteobacteria bacterium]|nr:type I-E CRISPR-associated protein Cse2/CasB [Deltaproteobacteria bacterium]
MRAKAAPGPAFFKAVALYLDDLLPSSDPARTDHEERWAAILAGLAHLRSLHRRGAGLGRVLAEVRYSEARFVRLMRMNRDQLLDELPRLARYLKVKGQAVDWSWAASLILTADTEGADGVRRALARGYFSKPEKKVS